jgi:hypothetical protein
VFNDVLRKQLAKVLELDIPEDAIDPLEHIRRIVDEYESKQREDVEDHVC